MPEIVALRSSTFATELCTAPDRQGSHAPGIPRDATVAKSPAEGQDALLVHGNRTPTHHLGIK